MLNAPTAPPPPEPQTRHAHPLCRMLRDLRRARKRSLADIEAEYPWIRAIVLGSYERGDRTPPLDKLDAIFGIYGYKLAAVPIARVPVRTDKTIIEMLREIADQLAERDQLDDDNDWSMD